MDVALYLVLVYVDELVVYSYSNVYVNLVFTFFGVASYGIVNVLGILSFVYFDLP